jgi:hypothetical protein
VPSSWAAAHEAATIGGMTLSNSFGDDWRHSVIIENVTTADPTLDYPRFIEGTAVPLGETPRQGRICQKPRSDTLSAPMGSGAHRVQWLDRKT